jgi:hypothetical protein
MRKQLSFITLLRFLMIVGCLITFSSKTYAQCDNLPANVEAGAAVTICFGAEIQLNGSFDEQVITPTLDINQNVNTACLANFGQVNLAQSFTAVGTTSCGAGLSFTTNTTSSVTISLWSNLPNAGGVQLAIATGTGTGTNEIDVTWPTVLLTPGNTYFILFTSSDVSLCVGGDTGNSYAGGNAFANTGFGSFPNFDFTFRTFSCGSAEEFIPLLEINQSVNATCLANFSQVDLAQSFTAVGTTSCGAGLSFTTNTTSSVTISLWDNLPNAGGVQLAIATAAGTGTNEIDVTWPTVSLTPGNIYFLVFTSSDFGLCAGGDTGNSYAGGNAFANTGFGSFPNFDFTFRTFSCGSAEEFIPLLEINQSVNATCLANFSQVDLAQSFTAIGTTSCGAGLSFTTNTTSSVTISLWSNLPNAGGVQLAIATAAGTGTNEIDVTWPTVSLTPGNIYFLVFTSSDFGLCAGGDTGNSYAGGNAFANTGFGSFPNFDFTFRTFSCGSAEEFNPLLEINQSVNATCLANFSQVDLAQSFTAVGTTSCGAGLSFTTNTTSSVTISLWSNLPNAGGVQLAIATAAGTGTNEIDVTWPTVSLTPGNIYFLVFTSSDFGLCAGGDTGNSYAGGNAFANTGFGSFPNFDFTFRTFSCGSAEEFIPLLEINQSVNATCLANFSQVDLAQSFTAVGTTSCGAGLSFTTNTTSSVTISLWDNLPNAGGVQLAIATAEGTGTNEIDVTWPTVSLTPGDIYFLVFTSSDFGLCAGGDTGNSYAGGNAFANAGFGSFPNFDFTFRTFSCSNPSGFEISWSGPNIISDGSTLNPTVAPTENSTYTLTVTDLSTGCSSFDSVEVIITPFSTGIDEVSACDSFTWIDGITYTLSNDTATFNIVGGAANGCDSLVTLNLVILGITDECGECIEGGDSNPDWNQSCADCVGVPNGTAFIDDCNVCVGGSTGLEPCDDLAPPINNDCVNATVLTPMVANVPYGLGLPAQTTAIGTLHGATASGSGSCGSTLDVFYSLNVPYENHYTITVNPFGGADVAFELLNACAGISLACVNNGGASVVESSVTLNLAAGDYIIRVSGASLSAPEGQFLINVQAAPVTKVMDGTGCNATGLQLEDVIRCNLVTGALDYEWRFVEVGGGLDATYVRGSNNRNLRLSWIDGIDYNKLYNVYVRAQFNLPGAGVVWGAYRIYGDVTLLGSSDCTVETGVSVTPTQVQPAYSPNSPLTSAPYALCNNVRANYVAAAEQYEWEFTGPAPIGTYCDQAQGSAGFPSNPACQADVCGIDPFCCETTWDGICADEASLFASCTSCLTPASTILVTSPSYFIPLSNVPGIQMNTVYQVRVRARVNGLWGTFGVQLPIQIGLPANTSVWVSHCNTVRPPSGAGSNVAAYNVCASQSYTFRFQHVSEPERIVVRPTYVCPFNTVVPALTPGQTYTVSVKVTQGGVAGDYSTSCPITIAGPQAEGIANDVAVTKVLETGNLGIYPNPNAGTEVRVDLNGIADGYHDVAVTIYDIYGKLMTRDVFGHQGAELSRLVRFENELATGMYLVHVTIDGETFATEKMVVK